MEESLQTALVIQSRVYVVVLEVNLDLMELKLVNIKNFNDELYVFEVLFLYLHSMKDCCYSVQNQNNFSELNLPENL